MVYLLCYTSYIFPGTIKKITSSGMSFHCMSELREVFLEESSLPCNRQDNESSGYGALWALPPRANMNYCGSQALPCWLREGPCL